MNYPFKLGVKEFFEKDEYLRFVMERDNLKITSELPNSASHPYVCMYQYYTDYNIPKIAMEVTRTSGLCVRTDCLNMITLSSCSNTFVEMENLWRLSDDESMNTAFRQTFSHTIWEEMFSFFRTSEMPELMNEISQMIRLGASAEDILFPKLWSFYWHKKYGVSHGEVEYDPATGLLTLSKDAEKMLPPPEYRKVGLTLERLLSEGFWALERPFDSVEMVKYRTENSPPLNVIPGMAASLL